MRAIPRIPGRYYFAIFVLASATLSFQILITRFFSVMLYYHFAFAAISLAMLGLTRGAMEVYNKPERYAPEQVGPEFARHAAWFAISGVGAMVAFLCVPLVIPESYVAAALALTALAFVIPFSESGVCITLLLTRLPYGGGWLYAADLTGAALGSSTSSWFYWSSIPSAPPSGSAPLPPGRAGWWYETTPISAAGA